MKIFAALFSAIAFLLAGANAADAAIPTECEYQRYYPGKEICGGKHWKISIAKECRTMWNTYPEGLVKDDPTCAKYKPVSKWSKYPWIAKRMQNWGK